MKANIPAHVVDLKKAESYGTWSSINCMMLDRRATVATFYIEVAGADESTKNKMAISRKLSMKLKEKGILPNQNSQNIDYRAVEEALQRKQRSRL